MINYETFKQVELKIAKVVSAERVEGSEKLLKLEVDLSFEKRQIIAGVGIKYQPEDLVGKNIVVVANLEPRKFTLRSDSGQVVLESQGMLLAASNETEGPVLLTTIEEIGPGSEVR